MPPKGKQVKSQGKKSKEKHPIFPPLILLQTELDRKARELVEIKMRVRTAEEINDSLNKETTQMQIEKNEYTHFMSKKASFRQTQLVTLTDYHRQQIQDINQEKEKMLKEYQQKQEDLRLQLIRKSQLLLEAKHELETMDGYKFIRDRQGDEIKRLQDEVECLRAEQVHEIARVKSTFEKEIAEQRTDGDIQIGEIQKRANLEADRFLHEQTLKIQHENTQLRKRIRNILKRKEKLYELKQRLEEEQLHLIRQFKLVTDLRKIRLDKS